MKDFGYKREPRKTPNDDRGSNKNQPLHPSDDRYHVALALILWVATYLINKGFGFEAGTKENGVVITIGVLIWLVITLHDYFKNRM